MRGRLMKKLYRFAIAAMLLSAALYAEVDDRGTGSGGVKKEEAGGLPADEGVKGKGVSGDKSQEEKTPGEDKFKNAPLPLEFTKLLKLSGMTFTMPDGFIPAEVDMDKCEDVNYFHAVRHPEKKIEVRYIIIPYRAAVRTEARVIPGSDSIYRFSASAIAVSIAGYESNILKTIEFNPEDVKEEFHADWGSSSVMNPESKFGEGYKLAVVTSLYRSGKGEAYIVFLFDNYRDVSKEYNAAFYSLMFSE